MVLGCVEYRLTEIKIGDKTTEASMTASKNLTLEVSDFGPVARASIELRPLTVFVGPSNTGKSYLAILLYALHKFVSKNNFAVINENSDLRASSDRKAIKLISWMQGIASAEQSGKAEKGLKNSENIIPNEFDIDKIISVTKRSGEIAAEEIARCFGVKSTNTLIKKTGRKMPSRVSIGKRGPNEQFLFELSLTIKKSGLEIELDKDKDAEYRVNDEHISSILRTQKLFELFIDDSEIEDSSDEQKSSIILLLSAMAEVAFSLLVDPLSQPVYYLPADRAGVMHGHKVFIGRIIEQATRFGIETSPSVSLLSGILGDFLDQMQKFSNLDDDFENQIAENFEKSLLEGKISAEVPSNGLGISEIAGPEFTYQPFGWNSSISLTNTSSMVSELAPIVLYLRHIVKPGNVLIIEEPESHLHPEKQADFTRQLTSLINSGIRVIITTHSVWIIEALANIIQVSELPSNERSGLLSEHYTINPNDLGVWLFEPKNNPKGSVVKEIKLNADAGNFPAGYDEITEALYGEWEEASNRLETLRIKND